MLVSLLSSRRRGHFADVPVASSNGSPVRLGPPPCDLDVVRFTGDVGGWAEGTEATVLEVYKTSAMVEVVDDEGTTLGLPVIPFACMTVVWEADREHAV